MMKNGSIEKFKAYSQFTSVGAFNKQISQWMKIYEKDFTKSEKVALIRLTRYSVKVVGVANVKIATVLKVIHEEYGGHGISRSTFKRMLVKAKTIGMIDIIELERNSGGQSSNLYVFQSYPTTEVDNTVRQSSVKTRKTEYKMTNYELIDSISHPTELPNNEQLNHHKTKDNSKTKDQKMNTKKRKESLDHSYTSDNVPDSFKNLVKSFFDSCDTIEEFWKMVQISAYKHDCDKGLALITDVATQSFKQTIRAMKKKVIRKPIAYFYGVLNKKFEDHYTRELTMLIDIYSNEFRSPSVQNTHWLYA